MEMLQRLMNFLDGSVSCYHAAANAADALRGAGAVSLEETESWRLTPGKVYTVCRGGSSLAAFRMPDGPFRGFLLAAAHTDSPTFKLRQNPEEAAPGGTVRLRTEPYGGGIYRSWLDRPLSAAGRAAVRRDGGVEMRLLNIDRDLLIIPSVAIHMDRNVNKGGELNPAADLFPLFASGDGKEGTLRSLAARAAGVEAEDLLETELFLYPRMKAVRAGAAGEFIVSPRLDDLQCAFACLEGFLAAQPRGCVPVLLLLNNEEVGSGTRQGADSTFVTDVLERIAQGCGLTPEDYRRTIAGSFLVSADNAHGVHPAHPELADAQDRPVLGGGVVIKYNANQRYTTDALSAAVFAGLCREAEVPVQRYSNRPDLPGGSTLGNILTRHLSIPAVDIGLAQLAMHSCCETGHAADTAHLVRAMTAYFSCALESSGDGRVKW